MSLKKRSLNLAFIVKILTILRYGRLHYYRDYIGNNTWAHVDMQYFFSTVELDITGYLFYLHAKTTFLTLPEDLRLLAKIFEDSPKHFPKISEDYVDFLRKPKIAEDFISLQ